MPGTRVPGNTPHTAHARSWARAPILAALPTYHNDLTWRTQSTPTACQLKLAHTTLLQGPETQRLDTHLWNSCERALTSSSGSAAAPLAHSEGAAPTSTASCQRPVASKGISTGKAQHMGLRWRLCKEEPCHATSFPTQQPLNLAASSSSSKALFTSTARSCGSGAASSYSARSSSASAAAGKIRGSTYWRSGTRAMMGRGKAMPAICTGAGCMQRTSGGEYGGTPARAHTKNDATLKTQFPRIWKWGQQAQHCAPPRRMLLLGRPRPGPPQTPLNTCDHPTSKGLSAQAPSICAGNYWLEPFP